MVVKGSGNLTLAAITLVALSIDSSPSAQANNGSEPIRVVLPRTLDRRDCRLQYFLVGAFGGQGGNVRADPDVPEFDIETVHEGQVETISFAVLPDGYGRTVQLRPEPLGVIPFRGRVQGLVDQKDQAISIDVEYMPFWTCEFFQLPDCLLGWWRIASVKLDDDSTFQVDLPDFLRDSAVARFDNPGDFTFRIRDPKTGNWLFELQPQDDKDALGKIRVAHDYPGEEIFDAVPAR